MGTAKFLEGCNCKTQIVVSGKGRLQVDKSKMVSRFDGYNHQHWLTKATTNCNSCCNGMPNAKITLMMVEP